jgi:RHH-type proline utilization regulon transcriptional repressor/proline dehydrogenase/delta 1-pyrroline-5-carboxylate dehydrogenase
MKRSAFGGGIKAGGPNYVSCLVNLTENGVAETVPHATDLSLLVADGRGRARVNAGYASFRKAWDEEFSQEKDVSHIYGEENIFRYLPLKNIGFRVAGNDSPADVLLVMAASHLAKTPLTVSVSADSPHLEVIEKAAALLPGTALVREDEQAFIDALARYERIRTCSAGLSDALYEQAARLGRHVADSRPLVEGRLEMLHYLKEQSIAYEYHRYGSIFGEEK